MCADIQYIFFSAAAFEVPPMWMTSWLVCHINMCMYVYAYIYVCVCFDVVIYFFM